MFQQQPNVCSVHTMSITAGCRTLLILESDHFTLHLLIQVFRHCLLPDCCCHGSTNLRSELNAPRWTSSSVLVSGAFCYK
ncbi:hypothetical protein ATANTOWER_020351, partial [Ataeniobius toweri]|nr:hypothetical protein [Ataeniobius toweri]